MPNNLPLIITIVLQATVILLCLLFMYRLFQLYRIYVSKTHLESTFDSIDDPLAIVDKDYHICRVNRSYAALNNDRFSQLIGKHCYTVLRNRNTPCEDCRLSEVLASGARQYVGHSPHPKLPLERTVSFTFYPFLEKNDRRISVVEHIRDTTELELLRAGLEERNKVLEETGLKLRKAQREMKDELDLARQVQQGTLPQSGPHYAPLKIDIAYQPIESVGGDVYDFVPLPGNRLGIFIGDASGHGLSSAFVATISKMLLKDHSTDDLPVDQLLTHMNRELLGIINTSHYLTCWWGIFDPQDNSITYSRAGHPLPIVIRANGDLLTLDAFGTFAGIIDTPQYEQRKVFLNKGDRCYFFTDGIYEVIDRSAAETSILGYKRFCDLIVSTNHLPFSQLIPALKEKLGGFLYEDDYTLITVEAQNEGINTCPAYFPGFSPSDAIACAAVCNTGDVLARLAVIKRTISRHGYDDDEVQGIAHCTALLADTVFERARTLGSAGNAILAYTADPTQVRVSLFLDGAQFDDHLRTKADPPDRDDNPPVNFILSFADTFGTSDNHTALFFTRAHRAGTRERPDDARPDSPKPIGSNA